MRKIGFIGIVFLLAGLGSAIGQEIPKPPPEDNPHAKALADTLYPSAKVCGECHPNQYRQWSLSSHAYADLSPMFNKFEQRINDISRGTVNYFCVRCHASVGTALGEQRSIARQNGILVTADEPNKPPKATRNGSGCTRPPSSRT